MVNATLKAGTKVKYVGETNGAYEKGKTYKIVGYDKELDAYGVMSDMDEPYCVAREDLEELQ